MLWISMIFQFTAIYVGIKWHLYALAIFPWISGFTIMFMDQGEDWNNEIMVLRHKGYPTDKCITPKKLRFLYIYRKDVEGGNEIPKEVVQKNVFGFYNIIVSGIVLLSAGEKCDGMISGLYTALDVLVIVIVMLTLSVKATIIAFENRFKKLNRYNWKYFFKNSNKLVSAETYGECKVVSIKIQGKRKYVTVKMLSTGETLENILFCGKLYRGKIYMLYEICHLKYVDHVPPKKVHRQIGNYKVIGGKTIIQKRS